MFILFALLFISCERSPESNANDLIKSSLRKVLVKPDSYKPIDTTIDSAFAPYDNPAIFETIISYSDDAKKMKDLDREIELSELSMSVYIDSYSSYEKIEYEQAKEKYDKAISKKEKIEKKIVEELLPVIDSLLSQNKSFVGWKVTHNYRAENTLGNTVVGNHIFIVDKNFEKVLLDLDKDDYRDYQRSIKDIKEQMDEIK